MTTLLTIAILLLVSIAVWQITKIFQVAQLNQKRGEDYNSTFG